jgi:hypothetical protein
MSLAAALKREPAGVAAVFAVADKHRLDRRELAWVIERESGWDPNIANPVSDARGLLQWMPKVRAKLGFPFLPSTIEGQAQVVDRFFASMRRVPPGDVYIATAAPAFVGHADGEVVYAVGSIEWKQNPGLRESPDGPITTSSIRARGTPPAGFVVPSAEQLAVLAARSSSSSSGAGGLLLLLLVAAFFGGKRRRVAQLW